MGKCPQDDQTHQQVEDDSWSIWRERERQDVPTWLLITQPPRHARLVGSCIRLISLQLMGFILWGLTDTAPDMPDNLSKLTGLTSYRVDRLERESGQKEETGQQASLLTALGRWKSSIRLFNSIPREEERCGFTCLNSKISKRFHCLYFISPHHIPKRHVGVGSTSCRLGGRLSLGGVVELDAVSRVSSPPQAAPLECAVTHFATSSHFIRAGAFTSDVVWNATFLSPHRTLLSPSALCGRMVPPCETRTHSELMFSISSTFLQIRAGISTTCASDKQKEFQGFPFEQSGDTGASSRQRSPRQSSRHRMD